MSLTKQFEAFIGQGISDPKGNEKVVNDLRALARANNLSLQFRVQGDPPNLCGTGIALIEIKKLSATEAPGPQWEIASVFCGLM